MKEMNQIGFGTYRIYNNEHINSLTYALQEGIKLSSTCAAWAKSKDLKVLANRPLNAFDEKGMHRLASKVYLMSKRRSLFYNRYICTHSIREFLWNFLGCSGS